MNFSSTKKDNNSLLGTWVALSYAEKLYKNGVLVNEDELLYDKNQHFEIKFKKNDAFVQTEQTNELGKIEAGKNKRGGMYKITGQTVTLYYGSSFDEESTVVLSFEVSQNGQQLTTKNVYERKDVDDIFKHESTRIFNKK
ncbi:hypothetical protein [Galbibacter mesophilus]|uniref:hypothetical protein n=1 Tax=Galbibacter mesophilus TaxID=379069 RepID=UPI00191CC387|nr:hypothetical protein [Galbibacter mesophilus]MCM5662125.1 hypothetical protein [Galbibacter mesophilus]